MKYDFVEIGCCYFDTCVDQYGLDCVGLLVEPVKEYYDVLPSSNTVKKECCAIGKVNGDITFTAAIPNNIRYIHHTDVMNMTKDAETYHKLSESEGPILIGGWSSINKETIHPDVLKYCKDITVKCMTFESLCLKYKISEIDHLKIDVEGNEAIILKSVLNMISENTLKVNTIRFEYNERSDKQQLDELILLFKDLYNYSASHVKQGFNEDCFLHII